MIQSTLVKFSISVDSVSATLYNWRHFQGDLCVVFSSFPAALSQDVLSADPDCMRVFQGSNVLTTINIAEKAKASVDAVEHARKINIELQHAQLPTAVLHRRGSCSIAFRCFWDDQGSSVLRVQMKFNSVTDFDTVLNHLASMGCPLSAAPEPRPILPAPVSSAVQPQIQTSMAPPMTEGHGIRMPSIRLNHGALTDSFNSSQPHAEQQSALNHLPRAQAVSSPLAQHTSSTSDLPLQPIQGQFHRDPSSSAPAATVSRHFIENVPRPSTALPYNGVSATSIAHEFLHSGAGSFHSPIPVQAALPRPPTAPIEALNQTLDDLVPPPRELPFPRARNRAKQPDTSSRTLSSPSTSTSKSDKRPMESDAAKGEKPKAAPRKSSAAAKKRSATSGEGQDGARPPAAKRRNTTTAKAKDPPAVTSASDPPVPTAPSAEPATSTDPRSDLAKILSMLTPNPADSSPDTSSSDDNMARYAAQPYTLRAQAVEAMVVRMIRDEGFVTLVEDVEKCWRRIGIERRS